MRGSLGIRSDALIPVQIVLQPLSLGTSNDLVVGQHVYALGNPFGLDHSLTTGACGVLVLVHLKTAEGKIIEKKDDRHVIFYR